LSHQQNAASIVPSRVIGHDDHYQLTELATLDGQPLWVTRLDATVGSELKLRIPARDVSLALTDAADSSILNRLRARIIQIEHSHSSRVLVKLQLGSHQLLARLTQKSVDRLQLTTGQTVYAQVKTVALLNEF
jgi:molybdate transport system ATP-binding protein